MTTFRKPLSAPPSRGEVLAVMRRPDVPSALNRVEVADLVRRERSRVTGRSLRPGEQGVGVVATGALLRALESAGVLVGAAGMAALDLGRHAGLVAASYYYALPGRVPPREDPAARPRRARDALAGALAGRVVSIHATPTGRIMVELTPGHAESIAADLARGADREGT